MVTASWHNILYRETGRLLQRVTLSLGKSRRTFYGNTSLNSIKFLYEEFGFSDSKDLDVYRSIWVFIVRTFSSIDELLKIHSFSAKYFCRSSIDNTLNLCDRHADLLDFATSSRTNILGVSLSNWVTSEVTFFVGGIRISVQVLRLVRYWPKRLTS